jgi:hypothetical protein
MAVVRVGWPFHALTVVVSGGRYQTPFFVTMPLNDIEAVWHDLEGASSGPLYLRDADALDRGINAVVKHLNSELKMLPFATLRTSA